MIPPVSSTMQTFHGKVVGNEFSGFGVVGKHSDEGLYRFEGKFRPARLIVNVQVAHPWADEVTLIEVKICNVHTGSSCPDDGEGCRRIKAVVSSPRWMPIISAMGTESFFVNIWRAPEVSEGGSVAVGESVRADVDFFIVGMEIS